VLMSEGKDGIDGHRLVDVGKGWQWTGHDNEEWVPVL
jgi:hypothetical protein